MVRTAAALLFCMVGGATLAAQDRLPLELLKLPDGFAIEVFYSDVPNARQMAMGDQGTLFVGSRQQGKVYALQDTDSDGYPDKRYIVARNLNMPSGITFRQGALYVAAVDTVYRFPNIEQALDSPERETVLSGLPSERHHGWKYIDFGPDGWLYLPIGAPCNICLSKDPRFASIQRWDPVSGKLELVAEGVRNSVGFDWHPQTKELWFSDNGRDWMGDDLPPDELNRVTEFGKHYGYPFWHGGVLADDEYPPTKPAAEYEQPMLNLQAHVAPLGIQFYQGEHFPSGYRERLFVAEHGSWNRSTKVGYRVMMAEISKGQVTGYRPFVSGWLQEEDVWGRPVALLEWKDGSMLISDDFAGVIYRVSHTSR